MYKIEFNEQMTINGILESFKNIKEAGEQAFIEINGVRIYHDEPKLESRITEEYRKYHETHRRTTEVRKEAPKKEKSLEETTGDALTNAFFLNNDPEFLFELGVVLEHTPEEKRKRLIDWYISVYGITSEQKSEDYKDLKYLSNLILILEDDCSLLKKRIQVQEMINSFSNDAMRTNGDRTSTRESSSEFFRIISLSSASLIFERLPLPTSFSACLM